MSSNNIYYTFITVGLVIALVLGLSGTGSSKAKARGQHKEDVFAEDAQYRVAYTEGATRAVLDMAVRLRMDSTVVGARTLGYLDSTLMRADTLSHYYHQQLEALNALEQ